MTSIEFFFLAPDGEPIANKEFTLQLAESSFIDPIDGVLMPRILTYETDAQGKIVLDLQPSGKPYFVEVQGNTEDEIIAYKFYVPDNPELVRAQDLFIAVAPSKTPYDEAALLIITDSKIASMQARTAAEAAQAASELAQTASETAQSKAELAQGLAEAAQASSEDAQEASEIAQLASENARDASIVAQGLSEDAQVASEAARDLSQSYRNSSQSFAQASSGSATAANTSALTAQGAATTATTKAGEASSSATAASNSASAAATSATNAFNSASAASGSASTASTHATNANQSKLDAITAKDLAEGFASAASTSATNANLSMLEVEAIKDTILDADVTVSRLSRGFHWNVDSNTNNGQAINDWSTGGTGTYVALASSGSTFANNTEYHQFTSAAATYSIAGMRSAQPVVKRGTHPVMGGFIFEGIWGPGTFVPGSVGLFGLFGSSNQAYGSFSGTDVGIGIGWQANEIATDALMLLVGSGIAVTAQTIPGTELGDNSSYYLRMKCEPAGTVIYVTLVDLDSGIRLLENEAISTNIPDANTPLYALAHVGTVALDTAVTSNLWGMSAYPYQNY